MNELKLYDIKPLVEVPDFSLYLFIILILFGSVLLLTLLYLLYHFFKYRKKDERKEHYKMLKELDLSDAKNAAYTLTKYGRLLAQTDREKKFYYLLVEVLEEYKYKKDVKPLSKNARIKYENFMDELDV